MSYDDDSRVIPDGLTIRRRRRSRGWSKRAFLQAMADARERESGLRQTISINQLEWIEETNEPVPYGTVCHIAAGLDCNPMELVSEGG